MEMEEVKTKTVKYSEYIINSDEDVDIDEELPEDPGTRAFETSNRKNDQLLKFEKYKEMKGDIMRYTDEVKKIQIEPIDNREEMERLEKEVGIEFDAGKVDTVIKRGREEIRGKLEEFKDMRDKLDQERRFLEDEKDELDEKEKIHGVEVGKVEQEQNELTEIQKEIIKRCDSVGEEKIKFAEIYAKTKQDSEENVKKAICLKSKKYKHKGAIE